MAKSQSIQKKVSKQAGLSMKASGEMVADAHKNKKAKRKNKNLKKVK